MSTENKNMPRLRFPGFTGEWVEKKLGEVGDTYNGLSGKSKEDFENGNSKFITFMNVLNNVIINKDILAIVDIKEDERQNKVENGDMLFNTSSETPEEVGYCSVYATKNSENVYLNSFCFGYRFKSQLEYYPLFLAYFFRSCYGRKLMYKLAQGVTRYNLSKENFNKILISFPTLAEQQKIAECLTAIDDLIVAQGKKVDALKEHKKGLMQQLFPQRGETTPRLRFPGFAGEWVEKKLGEVAVRINRRNSQLLISRVLTNSANFGVVDQNEYFDRDIAIRENTSNYHIVDVDDFVYNPRISAVAPVGPISINKVGVGIMSPLYTIFRIHSGVISFFEQYFQTAIWHSYLKSIANFGARFDRMNITIEGFFNMPLYLPSLAEQQKIAECLSTLDEQIKAESAELDALKEHKKGLMQQLFPQPTK